MKFRNERTLAALLFLSAFSARGDEWAARMDPIVVRAMTEWRVPGLALAAIKDGELIFLKGYGYRESGKPETVNADTLFGIGSTTKAFTSAAIAALVDDGIITWEDSPRRHLPYFRLSDPCADSAVTIRDILTHRTGLARHDELWDYTSWSREQVIRALGEIPLDAPFRSEHQYQNVMFIAAGEIVGRASGQSWEQFVQGRLLDPLEMKRTTLSIVQARQNPNHATGHRRNSATGEIEPFPWDDDKTIGPSGAIHSSARDMSRWIRMHLNEGAFEGKQVISKASLKETRMPHTPMRLTGSTAEFHPQTTMMSYAMGWTVQDYDGEAVVTHLGALNGFRANVTLLPRRRSGFVILSNTGPYAPVHALRNTLIDLLTGKEVRDWITHYDALQTRAEKEEQAELQKRNHGRHANTQPSRELLHYVGSYSADGYGRAEVRLQDDRLVLSWGRLRASLDHFHYDSFRMRSEREELDELVTFALGPNGEIASLLLFKKRFERLPSSPQR